MCISLYTVIFQSGFTCLTRADKKFDIIISTLFLSNAIFFVAVKIAIPWEYKNKSKNTFFAISEYIPSISAKLLACFSCNIQYGIQNHFFCYSCFRWHYIISLLIIVILHMLYNGCNILVEFCQLL